MAAAHTLLGICSPPLTKSGGQTKKEVFALKTMQKARIVATKQQRNVLNEKRIMMECDHPYVRTPAAAPVLPSRPIAHRR